MRPKQFAKVGARQGLLRSSAGAPSALLEANKLIDELPAEKSRTVTRPAWAFVRPINGLFWGQPCEDVANICQQHDLDIGLNIFLTVDLTKRSRRRSGAFQPFSARYVGDAADRMAENILAT